MVQTKNISTVPYRRKREGKTDYRLRLRLLSGGKPRLVVRRSLKNIQAQVVRHHPDGDQILCSAHSRELCKLGWPFALTSTPAAYLVGQLVGKKAHAHSIAEAVLDIGMQQSVKGGVIYAVVKGAQDAGLAVPCNKTMFPSPERLMGRHIPPVQYKHSAGTGTGQSLSDIAEIMKKKIGGIGGIQ